MRRSTFSLLRASILTALLGCPPGDKADDTASGARCVSPTSILLADGSASGFVRCEDGAVNRVSAEAVDPTIDTPACVGDEEVRACETDAECTDGAYAKCISYIDSDTYIGYGDSWTACGCVYSCASDADCASGEVCLSPDVEPLVWPAYPACVPAECNTDDDCASGECGVGAYDDGCDTTIALSCRDTADACRADDDCSGTETCWDGSDWSCATTDCVIGRPLMVDGDARVAPAAARADWTTDLLVRFPADATERAALAAYWTRIAAFEHASVASFARVTLQLMALGAPRDLLADTQQAALDEVSHAAFAYTLASRYAAPIGPGALPYGGVFVDTSARGVMLAVIEEACVGETMGAAELLAAADGAEEPALAAALRKAGEDEARHAALAWRTLAWLLDTHPELRPEAEGALTARIARARRDGPTDSPDLPAYGVPGREARAAVHAQVLDDLVPECLGALRAA